MGEYDDKNVVITGGGSGMGFASMARSVSRELLARGVRVNAVSPGPIDTGILENTITAEAAAQFKAQVVADNPMQRFGTLDEFARAAAFLAFGATYTTGTEFALDGGATQLCTARPTRSAMGA